MPPLLVKRTGFLPWMSVSRYCLDTILECGSLFTLSVAERLPLFYRRAFKKAEEKQKGPRPSRGPTPIPSNVLHASALLLFFARFFGRRGGSLSRRRSCVLRM